MKLHEYQGKEILASYGVPVSSGVVASTVEEAVAGAQTLYSAPTGNEVYVIKAQVHAGGRGKAGGVKIVKGLEAAKEAAKNMIGMKLITPQTGEQGKIVNKIFITPDAFYPGETTPQEFYVSITLDRSKECDVVIASAEGGVEIEEVAEKHPEKIIKEWVNPRFGLLPFQARRMALALGLRGEAFKNAVAFILKLYDIYLKTDAAMIEINPMLKTSDNKIIALDCKYALDENALYRHPEYHHYRDLTEEDPLETEAKAHDLNYVKLDGNVGCMVNGAGLAMATMDIIKLSGGEPANFLDVGGGANAKTVEAGFRIILKDPNVKAILINIFGGIVQCDRVANGVVEAYKNIGNIPVPIIVRLQGTNAEKAAQIINQSGLKVTSAIELREAAIRVQEALQGIA
jgi:succinyl-CoA synthetase beta subunit